MARTPLELKVDDFLAQKRIAVVGASRDKRHPVGGAVYRRLKQTGHEVFAVNPHAETSRAIVVTPTCDPFPAASTAW